MRTRLKLTAPTATLDTPNPISSTESTRRLPMIWLLVHILPRSSFLPDQPGKPRILILLRRSRLLKSTPNFSSFAGSRGGAVHPWPAGAAEGRWGGPGSGSGSGSAGPRAAPRSAAPRRQRAQPRRRGALQGAGPAAGTGRRGRSAGQRGSPYAAPRSSGAAPPPEKSTLSDRLLRSH